MAIVVRSNFEMKAYNRATDIARALFMTHYELIEIDGNEKHRYAYKIVPQKLHSKWRR